MKKIRRRAGIKITARFWLWFYDKMGYTLTWVAHLNPFGESYYAIEGEKNVRNNLHT